MRVPVSGEGSLNATPVADRDDVWDVDDDRRAKHDVANRLCLLAESEFASKLSPSICTHVVEGPVLGAYVTVDGQDWSGLPHHALQAAPVDSDRTRVAEGLRAHALGRFGEKSGRLKVHAPHALHLPNLGAEVQHSVTASDKPVVVVCIEKV